MKSSKKRNFLYIAAVVSVLLGIALITVYSAVRFTGLLLVLAGGVIALCGERTLPPPTFDTLPRNGFLCMIEGIEDPYNFGYALRSLYAAGVDGVLLGERNWMQAAGGLTRLCRRHDRERQALP